MRRVIISSDMDGTLLGHDSYDCEVAKPLIAGIIAADVPIILNTSKTATEVRHWQSKLGLNLPAIVENGSALLKGNTYSHIYGASMPDLEAFLVQNPPDAINFLTCSQDTAAELTDLTGQALEAARTRDFSIPLQFTNETVAKRFANQAQARGLQCIRGGRFYSLQGRCDKGTTLKHLISQYEKAWQSEITVIALGDNHNDLGMLMAADVAVIVKTAGKHAITVDHPAAIYTADEAPNGWVEGVTKALQALSIDLDINLGIDLSNDLMNDLSSDQ